MKSELRASRMSARISLRLSGGVGGCSASALWLAGEGKTSAGVTTAAMDVLLTRVGCHESADAEPSGVCSVHVDCEDEGRACHDELGLLEYLQPGALGERAVLGRAHRVRVKEWARLDQVLWLQFETRLSVCGARRRSPRSGGGAFLLRHTSSRPLRLHSHTRSIMSSSMLLLLSRRAGTSHPCTLRSFSTSAGLLNKASRARTARPVVKPPTASAIPDRLRGTGAGADPRAYGSGDTVVGRDEVPSQAGSLIEEQTVQGTQPAPAQPEPIPAQAQSVVTEG